MNKVIVEKNGPVKTVWMNRPEKRNALDSELLGNMIEALQAPVAAEDRVLVIRGKGDVFCAGLDMAERSKSAGAGEASGIEIMLRAIELCPLPVVAVVWRCIATWWWRARRRASACRWPRSASRPTGSWPRS